MIKSDPSHCPALAVTLGDPAGVGAEVIVKALADPEIAALARFIVVGEPELLREVAAMVGVPAPEEIYALNAVRSGEFTPGMVSGICGRAAVAYIEAATKMCLRGEADGMVTAPVNKEAVTRAGIPFTGHTEFIAEVCGVEEPRMLLVNDHLRVIHVTTHCALRQACEMDAAQIIHTVRLGAEAMRFLGFAEPRIAVCGLNPHAGENGLFGIEDLSVVSPAVEAAQAEGITCSGPIAADTLFFRAARGEFDLVVALYHDQGHIPMKLLDFENTVNVSLGLPIIRTSVDHGTAFGIVGKNLASASSMKAALRLAAAMAGGKRHWAAKGAGA